MKLFKQFCTTEQEIERHRDIKKSSWFLVCHRNKEWKSGPSHAKNVQSNYLDDKSESRIRLRRWRKVRSKKIRVIHLVSQKFNLDTDQDLYLHIKSTNISVRMMWLNLSEFMIRNESDSDTEFSKIVLLNSQNSLTLSWPSKTGIQSLFRYTLRDIRKNKKNLKLPALSEHPLGHNFI